ncbi:unnamed protein product [Psylliodes chrysocephalus]|uniref:MADF domain-containing protein n=1 Tax=Psylliodes chrysocephalus TaxID=3402493 RepID=A0A9P0CKF1_9CUCU|nr:unnamed protein product [Psylliodes chrysocephala]
MTAYFIGIDVGTGSVRAALVTDTGEIIKIGVKEIKTWNNQTDFYEQSTDDIWNAIITCIKSITEGVDPEKVIGIGFDATCSLACFDKSGAPLSVSPTGNNDQNVILWLDHRAVKEADEINNLKHPVLKYVGGKISPEMETPKLLWLKRNLKADCWDKAGYFFDLPDFLTWKATDADSRSSCSLVCKWTYEISETDCREGWNKSYFEQIGLDDLAANNWKKIGSLVLPPGTPVGNGLSQSAAAQFGLKAGTAVGASMIDAHAGGLGLIGCIADGIDPAFHTRLVSCLKMSWSRQQVEELIDAYFEHPCLYNVHLKLYHNKHARNAALEIIKEALSTVRPGITIPEIKSKWNGLKTNCSTEHKKIQQSQTSGAGTDDIYTPSIWYYSKLSFLLDYTKPRKSMDSISDQVESDVLHGEICEEEENMFSQFSAHSDIIIEYENDSQIESYSSERTDASSIPTAIQNIRNNIDTLIHEECQSQQDPQELNLNDNIQSGPSTSKKRWFVENKICDIIVVQAIFAPGIWGPYKNAMVPGMWLNEGGQSATGKLIDHIIDNHPATPGIREQLANMHIQQYLTELLEDLTDKKELSSMAFLTKDLHVWPDFHGNRSPIADPSLKGTVCIYK